MYLFLQDLRGIAEEYGAVETVTIIKTNQSKKSKGCGFVKYASREDAVKAINVRNLVSLSKL